MLIWIEFLTITGLILFSGNRLSRYGDIIAEKTGLSRLWLGMVLMAAVTSLPELATGLSSVLVAGLPDIAAGDILGSCVFNLAILSIIDALSKKKPLYSLAHQGNLLTAGMFMPLISAVGLSLFLGGRVPALGWFGLTTPLILAGYLGAMALAFRYEKRGSPAAGIHECPVDMYKEIPLKKAVVGYVFNAAVVVGSAIFLPRIAEGLAEMTGLGRTFVGTIFIALSTSLPELTVTISSFRLGAVDMAVGNLFGSNLFNLAILALDDLFYVRGPLLGDVEPQHLISVFAIMAMNGLAAAGLIYRSESKRFLMAWESWAIAAVFVLNLFLLYALH